MSDLSLEGDIAVPGAPAEEDDRFNTLDEPVSATVVSDVSERNCERHSKSSEFEENVVPQHGVCAANLHILFDLLFFEHFR